MMSFLGGNFRPFFFFVVAVVLNYAFKSIKIEDMKNSQTSFRTPFTFSYPHMGTK